MKPSSWALRATTEFEIAEERRQIRRRKQIGWSFLLASLGLWPLSCLGAGSLALDSPLRLAALLSISVLLFSAGLAAYGRQFRRVHDLSNARLGGLREEYADLRGWLVEITILQGAAPTGFDRGVIWFEEDRLLFVGERTSFALGSASVRRGPRDHWGTSGLLPTTTLPLRASSPAGGVSLGFTVHADDVPGKAHWGAVGLLMALRGWSSAGGTEPGQGPPLAIGPGSPSSTALLWGALGVTALWSLIVAVLAAVAVAGEFGVAAVVTGFVVVASLAAPDLWTFRLRWRAWRDRRRLDREAFR